MEFKPVIEVFIFLSLITKSKLSIIRFEKLLRASEIHLSVSFEFFDDAYLT